MSCVESFFLAWLFTDKTASAAFVAQLRSSNRRVLVALGGAKGYSTGWSYLTGATETARFATSLRSFVDRVSRHSLVRDEWVFFNWGVYSLALMASMWTMRSWIRF